MSTVVLIPWAKNDWTDTGRHVATVTLPLTDEGRRQASQWALGMQSRSLRYLYASDEQTSQETAEAIAETVHAKIKTVGGLDEVNFGLWAGLTEDTLESRFSKAFKRWKEDPTAVCPPEGEPLDAAAQRLARSLQKAIHKSGDGAVGVVLGPVACAVARCRFERAGLGRMRDFLTAEPVWYEEASMLAGGSVPGETDAKDLANSREREVREVRERGNVG